MRSSSLDPARNKGESSRHGDAKRSRQCKDSLPAASLSGYESGAEDKDVVSEQRSLPRAESKSGQQLLYKQAVPPSPNPPSEDAQVSLLNTSQFIEELNDLEGLLRQEFEQKVLMKALQKVRVIEARLAHDAQLELDAQRRRSREELSSVTQERDTLREHVADQKITNEAAITRANVMGERLATFHMRTSKNGVSARCFEAWRTMARTIRKERAKDERAAVHARRLTTTRAFNGWRAETKHRLNTRESRAANAKLEAVSKEIIGRYEAELSNVRSALEEAKRQVLAERAKHKEIEEGMRRTLLRGMSAMSMEAMSVLNGTRGSVDSAGDEPILDASDGFWNGDCVRMQPYDPRLSPLQDPPSRISEECPRPLEPPRPSFPSSR